MAKGRPREFDTEEALDKAIIVFWRKGYRGTSLDDLTEAMEINRPSLYAAFVDKERLFLSAIDRYRSKFLAPPTKKLINASSLREGLPEFLKGMGAVILNDETPPGCMIACLLSEECCDSAAIKGKLLDSIALADSTFQPIFEKHKAELAPGIDPATAARLLTTALHGMAIRARAGGGKRDLVRISSGLVRALLCG
ncbi:MAG TPA: TetR/AcrR family transcriptional regulator [Candidatus Obscuribacterales bacterium]